MADMNVTPLIGVVLVLLMSAPPLTQRQAAAAR